jgi:hypothetical protein
MISQARPAPPLLTTWTGPALGHAAPIIPDAAALVGYPSPHQSRPANGELEEDEELSRLHGTFKIDEEVSKPTARTTRKDYPTHVGISLPIRDLVGEDYHEVQFWEEVYPEVLRQLWLSELAKLSPRLEIECDNLGQDLSCKMRYQGNALRVWFTPTANILAGLT